jgi:hypothetical protein
VNARAQSLKIALVGALENNSAHSVCVAKARNKSETRYSEVLPCFDAADAIANLWLASRNFDDCSWWDRGDYGIDFPIDLLHWLPAMAQCAKGNVSQCPAHV